MVAKKSGASSAPRRRERPSPEGESRWRLILPTPRAQRLGTPSLPEKPLIRSDLGNAPPLDMDALAGIAQRYPEQFVRRVEDLIAKRKFTLRSVRDVRGLFRALLPIKIKTSIVLAGMRAAVDTSAFPLLMGSLVVDEINRAYDAVPTIGQDLVRDMESNKRFAHVVKIVNFVSQELETKEGLEFPMISAGEQFAVIANKRKGFQLALTMEVLEENDISPFLELVDQGGQFAAEVIEEQTLSRVHDQNGSSSAPAQPYTFIPNGVPTQLYNSTANNPGTQAPKGTRILNNALSSTVNLDASRLVLAAMLNTRGRRIGIPMSEQTIVVPDALLSTALKISRSELEPGVFNEVNNWGPKGAFRPSLASSPKLDDISTTAWLMGAFQRQFVRKWKIRLETVSVYTDPMTYARTREAYRTRCAWDVEIGARDYPFVVQNLSGDATTAPAATTTNT